MLLLLKNWLFWRKGDDEIDKGEDEHEEGEEDGEEEKLYLANGRCIFCSLFWWTTLLLEACFNKDDDEPGEKDDDDIDDDGDIGDWISIDDVDDVRSIKIERLLLLLFSNGCFCLVNINDLSKSFLETKLLYKTLGIFIIIIIIINHKIKYFNYYFIYIYFTIYINTCV